MNQQELILVNNVAQKLELYMEANNQTIFALAKVMNIDKQPFYRIINRKNVPTLSSLFLIAQKLNCNIQELINDNVFIDVTIFSGLNLQETKEQNRIYISYVDYCNLRSYKLFAIKLLKELKVYYKITDFINDGIYLVNYNNQLEELDVLSAGSKFIIADVNGEEQKIDSYQIIPLAKFYKTLPITSNGNYATSLSDTTYSKEKV